MATHVFTPVRSRLRRRDALDGLRSLRWRYVVLAALESVVVTEDCFEFNLRSVCIQVCCISWLELHYTIIGYMVMAYTLMVYIVMAYTYSYGQYCDGLCTYGLYGYGLCHYGL